MALLIVAVYVATAVAFSVVVLPRRIGAAIHAGVTPSGDRMTSEQIKVATRAASSAPLLAFLGAIWPYFALLTAFNFAANLFVSDDE